MIIFTVYLNSNIKKLAPSAGIDLEVALQEVLVESLKETKDIVFKGDGYSDDWVVEVEKRGLLNLKTTADPCLILQQTKTLNSLRNIKY